MVLTDTTLTRTIAVVIIDNRGGKRTTFPFFLCQERFQKRIQFSADNGREDTDEEGPVPLCLIKNAAGKKGTQRSAEEVLSSGR